MSFNYTIYSINLEHSLWHTYVLSMHLNYIKLFKNVTKLTVFNQKNKKLQKQTKQGWGRKKYTQKNNGTKHVQF